MYTCPTGLQFITKRLLDDIHWDVVCSQSQTDPAAIRTPFRSPPFCRTSNRNAVGRRSILLEFSGKRLGFRIDLFNDPLEPYPVLYLKRVDVSPRINFASCIETGMTKLLWRGVQYVWLCLHWSHFVQGCNSVLCKKFFVVHASQVYLSSRCRNGCLMRWLSPCQWWSTCSVCARYETRLTMPRLPGPPLGHFHVVISYYTIHIFRHPLQPLSIDPQRQHL